MCYSKTDSSSTMVKDQRIFEKGTHKMNDTLKSSWNAFPKSIAQRYLKSFGHPSQDSQLVLYEVLEKLGPKPMRLVDLGCGNGNLGEYLTEKGLAFTYTGVDFSDILLDAAREAFPSGNFVCDDVNTLANLHESFDVACYSHVIEMLPSPESSLRAASRIAKKIVIRFFEPPAEREDWVELLDMDIGSTHKVPYLRRRMSLDYYRLILSKIDCKQVDIYRSTSKDQIHVLHFS